uniref:peptidylprolyl isomerase n=1 Tax=Alexandrium monilatum TaxID=311494 RepID=A0A7S4VCT8_9DINO
MRPGPSHSLRFLVLLLAGAVWVAGIWATATHTTRSELVNMAWVGHSAPSSGASDRRALAVARGAEQVPGFKTTRETLQAGTGNDVVAKGRQVTVHATGVVQQTGKKFWSTKDPGQEPFTYNADAGQVIKGWDQGCLGMKVGEVRKLVIPAEEGYGAGGFPAWGIPPGGTLEFTLECLEIK